MAGCGEITGNNNKRAGASSIQPGKLYVANSGDGSLVAFDNALTAQGNISFSRRFPETITGPTGLFLDRANDTLYVANTQGNAILIYEKASTLNPPLGSAAATRVISGPKTGLNHPFAVAYDGIQIYVANKENSILVFQPGCREANTLSGNIPPCRTLAGAATLLDFPRGLAVDRNRDILYISNMGSNSILVYDQASQMTTQGDLAPSRTIIPHTNESEIESMLYLPWGIFVDSVRDRLYVVNPGRNKPAVLIYENASTRSGPTPPERAIVGQKTLLTFPAGIDVDVDKRRIFVVNNNNTNNVGNESGINSTASTAIVIFNDTDTSCKTNLCDLSPNRKIGGDVTKESSTTLANAVGIAVDTRLDSIYLSNPPASNILVFGLDGNISPIKLNSGGLRSSDKTLLKAPSGLFYDEAQDRLYVINADAAINPPTPPISVFEKVSGRSFANTPPDWTITGGICGVGPCIITPKGIYVDRSRNRLIVLSSGTASLLVYALPVSPLPGATTVALTPLATFTGGINQPTGISVDKTKGDVYISNSPLPIGNQSIAVYHFDTNTSNYEGMALARTIQGAATKLTNPSGLFIDTTNNILYVTNVLKNFVGEPFANVVLAFHNASASTGNISPGRTISSSAAAPLEEKMDAPIAPFVDANRDHLYLINRNQNSLFIFNHASTIQGDRAPDRKVAGGKTGLNFFFPQPGALWVDSSQGKETIYVGQPRDTISQSCDPSQTCPRGALLVFGVEGNIPPSRIWSGGEASLAGPSAIAVDTQRDILYAASQGDPTATSDDALSIFATASEANSNFPLTGTVEVTKASPLVTGTGTAFTKELVLGDTFKVGTESLTVSVIHSDTSLTLVTPYSGENASGLIAFRGSRTLCSPAGVSCTGPDTRLNNPGGLFIDPDQDRLYVSNSGTTGCDPARTPCNAILVFEGASGLGLNTHNATPDQTIESGALNNPRGVAVDLGRETLYVANTGSHSVLIFKNVESLKGTVSPDAEIGGIATRINQPVGVAIDPERDLLYVLNQGEPEILVFERASNQNGNVPPARVISGKSLLVKPSALFVDPENDLLYVADEGTQGVADPGTITESPHPPGVIFVFLNASRAQGNAEHKTLTGNNTGLNKPAALFVDTTR